MGVASKIQHWEFLNGDLVFLGEKDNTNSVTYRAIFLNGNWMDVSKMEPVSTVQKYIQHSCANLTKFSGNECSLTGVHNVSTNVHSSSARQAPVVLILLVSLLSLMLLLLLLVWVVHCCFSICIVRDRQMHIFTIQET